MTTYKEAGVDIDSTDALVKNISSLSKTTNRKGNFDEIGGFGGIFDLKKSGYTDPLLVSGTDGIGTKILLGIETDILEGLGHDLVGMCLNDILCHGAEPLFFLDYYASSKVDKNSFGKLTRLKELRIKHQKINAEIDQISSNPETDQLSLRRLKTRRLLLKDMIASLESSLIPNIDA